MSTIRFFSSSGVGSSKPSEALDYLRSPYCALTEEQRKRYAELTNAIQKALTNKTDADDLLDARNLITGNLRTPPPEVISYNKEAVIYAIASTPHKYKYNSGVIAFAKEDNQILKQNSQIESEYRQLFEELVFAGLPESDRLIEWVKHTHAGNIENHFVIPRIHLRTGRYFNAHPPMSAADFNALKLFIDTKYGLTTNIAPERRQLFGHISPYDPQRKTKQTIYDQLKTFSCQKKIKLNHDVVIAWFSIPEVQIQFAIKAVNQKKDHLQLVLDGKCKAIRLTGSLFSGTEPENIPILEPTKLHQELLRRIKKRSRFNRDRYSCNIDSELRLIYTPTLDKPQARFLTKPALSPSRSSLEDLIMALAKFIANILKYIINMIMGNKNYDTFRESVVQSFKYYSTNNGIAAATVPTGYAENNSTISTGAESPTGKNGFNSSTVNPGQGSITNLVAELQRGIENEREFQNELIENIDSSSARCGEIAERNRCISQLADSAFTGITNNFLTAMQRISMYKNFHNQPHNNKNNYSVKNTNLNNEPKP